MAMDTLFATLACYLLAIPFAVAQTQTDKLTVTPTITTPDLNTTLTETTLSSSNSTGRVTVFSNSTENTTPFTSTTRDNGTFTNATAATPEGTSPLQTPQSTTDVTPLTNSTTPTTTTPGTPTSTALTTLTRSTAGYISTPDTTVITTANSSHTVNTTSGSVGTTTQGLRLNISEKSMTIVFSVVLGVFALTGVVFMFHRCKHKIQYLHQPLNNMTDEFVADEDTLVISGGLYDGHPIYDNVPTAPADQSQFHLQFLH
ncbi:cell wall protein DAN4 isoform X1 [Anarrhichthys ocellatus]|uniref:cell wall protein DAN4 isoform X1 n=1 Tax=Anarrhichthys ocellatus TaxID=433405 RepID=UPI0012EE9B09|nr:cell wall protein DAN4-like isoform X1 [Anarrhichthys ocellatus]XP_031734191.1 cell wall protein DAN4-like isoform X1 [Anarrhichthys ocellatus]